MIYRIDRKEKTKKWNLDLNYKKENRMRGDMQKSLGRG